MRDGVRENLLPLAVTVIFLVGAVLILVGFVVFFAGWSSQLFEVAMLGGGF